MKICENHRLIVEFSSHVWPEGSPAKLSTKPRLCSEVSDCPAKL